MNQEITRCWSGVQLKNPHRLEDKSLRVRRMFSSVAGTYDLLNHLLSLNLDVSWRRRAALMAEPQSGHKILDLCCGTGDLALTLARSCPHLEEITGVDFSEEMLNIARRKSQRFIRSQQAESRGIRRFKWMTADVQHLPALDNCFDRVCCAFGIRNLQYPSAGIAEAFRVLKPGGRMVILEFDLPRRPILRKIYHLYFQLLLPLIGNLISGGRSNAYRYLPASVKTFNTDVTLTKMLGEAGFISIEKQPLTFGIVLLLTAIKPDER